MDLTVAICTFNRAELLRQTLTGLARQEYPNGLLEVLVIDNNSSDHTPEVVESFIPSMPSLRRVHEAKQGLDHARNRAIAEAKGEIIIFGDDDIIVEPDWLVRITAPFAADTGGRVGAVGGEVIPVFPAGLPPWISEWHAPLAFRTEAGPLQPGQSPMGANLAFPKRVFKDHGLFRTALDRTGHHLFGGGDSEMVGRLRAAGLEIWFAPAARVLHQMPASRTTFGYVARHAFDSARSRVVDRASRPNSVRYLLTRFLGNFLKAIGFFLLALGCALIMRSGAAKKALVRGWRACGYLYQIPRSLAGEI